MQLPFLRNSRKIFIIAKSWLFALGLEDGENIGGTSNTTGDVTWFAAHKEAPPSFLLAHLGQLLEPKQLPYGASIASQEDLVQRPVLLRGPRLEARLVPGHGRKVVPDPANHVVALLDAAKVVGEDGLVGGQLGGRQGGELGVPAGADEEDVAKVDGGALGGETGLQVGEGDGRGLEAGKGLDLGVRVGGAPGGEVDEDAAAYDALLGEGCIYV